MDFEFKDKYSISDLIQIVGLLRAPGGCPWDAKQTHESIRKNFLEETSEVLEAIDKKDRELLKEELGDVLLQVVFHSQIESEEGSFGFSEVADGICKKLILRHPHVFAGTKVSGSGEVLENWDKIKMKSKNQKSIADSMESVCRVLPALMRSEKVLEKSKKLDFGAEILQEYFSNIKSAFENLHSAIEGNKSDSSKERLGDLLFSLSAVSVLLDIDAEDCLHYACDEFINRFREIETLKMSSLYNKGKES